MSYAAEKALAWLYPMAIGTSVVCCITSAVAWSHWQYVLNACPETNCGCYLHARATYRNFEGGHVAYCYYATYGLLLPLLVGIGLGVYHVYRVCMGTAKWKSSTATVRQRSGDMIVVTAESELTDSNISPYYWTPAATISCILAGYVLIYAAIYTDGFEVTCRQYRDSLLKEIQGIGQIVPVIKQRLSCAAVFDFMDYMVESSSYERRRYGRINTAACMYMTLICGWLSLFAWIVISIVNFVQIRRTREARV